MIKNPDEINEVDVQFTEAERPTTFKLTVTKHVRTVDPTKYGLTDVKQIKPADYFITSGDAVQKTLALQKVIQKQIAAIPRKSEPKLLKYRTALQTVLKDTRTLLKHLERARGESCFLETEYDNRILYVVAKNPRNRD